MFGKNLGRVLLAIVAGYLANGVLVAITEALFARLVPSVNSAPPLYYFVFDLVSQCAYTVIGGYVCCRIAESSRSSALYGLIGLGVVVGTISLAISWRTEPHWYGIALFVVYAPCIWIGWSVRARTICERAK